MSSGNSNPILRRLGVEGVGTSGHFIGGRFGKTAEEVEGNETATEELRSKNLAKSQDESQGFVQEKTVNQDLRVPPFCNFSIRTA